MFGIIWNAIRLAFGAIVRNKGRATLTVLGILIGIAAVTTVTALGEGMSNQVTGEIDSMASNAVTVYPQAVQASGARSKATGRLTDNDARAIARDAISVAYVAPFIGTQGQVVYGDKNVLTFLMGTTIPYFTIRKFNIANGEIWTESDELLKTKVCIIGATAAEGLFGTADPVGHIIRIGRSPYRIIGLLERRGNSPFGDDQDDRIIMPIGSFRARVMHTSPGRTDQIQTSATSDQTTERAEAQIDTILRQRHRIQPGHDPDFVIRNMAEFKKAREDMMNTIALLLTVVATISLVVGGIGVMNIMLVSVTERTREIGIRMSIGARMRDILTQFLVEALVLCVLGGVLGALLGVGLTALFSNMLHWPLKPGIQSLVMALGTSVAIGLVFGFLPARRAATLDPIDALRTD